MPDSYSSFLQILGQQGYMKFEDKSLLVLGSVYVFVVLALR